LARVGHNREQGSGIGNQGRQITLNP
jgi:hypothetical protein